MQLSPKPWWWITWLSNVIDKIPLQYILKVEYLRDKKTGCRFDITVCMLIESLHVVIIVAFQSSILNTRFSTHYNLNGITDQRACILFGCRDCDGSQSMGSCRFGCQESLETSCWQRFCKSKNQKGVVWSIVEHQYEEQRAKLKWNTESWWTCTCVSLRWHICLLDSTVSDRSRTVQSSSGPDYNVYFSNCYFKRKLRKWKMMKQKEMPIHSIATLLPSCAETSLAIEKSCNTYWSMSWPLQSVIESFICSGTIHVSFHFFTNWIASFFVECVRCFLWDGAHDQWYFDWAWQRTKKFNCNHKTLLNRKLKQSLMKLKWMSHQCHHMHHPFHQSQWVSFKLCTCFIPCLSLNMAGQFDSFQLKSTQWIYSSLPCFLFVLCVEYVGSGGATRTCVRYWLDGVVWCDLLLSKISIVKHVCVGTVRLYRAPMAIEAPIPRMSGEKPNNTRDVFIYGWWVERMWLTLFLFLFLFLTINNKFVIVWSWSTVKLPNSKWAKLNLVVLLPCCQLLHHTLPSNSHFHPSSNIMLIPSLIFIKEHLFAVHEGDLIAHFDW